MTLIEDIYQMRKSIDKNWFKRYLKEVKQIMGKQKPIKLFVDLEQYWSLFNTYLQIKIKEVFSIKFWFLLQYIQLVYMTFRVNFKLFKNNKFW